MWCKSVFFFFLLRTFGIFYISNTAYVSRYVPVFFFCPVCNRLFYRNFRSDHQTLKVVYDSEICLVGLVGGGRGSVVFFFNFSFVVFITIGINIERKIRRFTHEAVSVVFNGFFFLTEFD